jgi:hypothetical protein
MLFDFPINGFRAYDSLQLSPCIQGAERLRVHEPTRAKDRRLAKA